MQRKWLFALGAAGLFTLQFLLEQARSALPLTLTALANELVEAGLLAGAVALIALVATETRDLRLERLRLIEDLAMARSEGERWRQAARGHVAGLSQAIAAQLQAWGLTEAEGDVAGLMLKGLSHKEIAALRDCSEATIRQHATAVYRKSNLAGRTQLTAYFLEDLLAPVPTGPALSVVGTDKDRQQRG